MMYVVYDESTKLVLTIIETDKNKESVCANGIAFKRYDDDMQPIFLQTEDGTVYLKENATIYNDLMRTKR